MFICEKCLKENYLNDYFAPIPSLGKCEICEENKECTDIPAKFLKARTMEENLQKEECDFGKSKIISAILVTGKKGEIIYYNDTWYVPQPKEECRCKNCIKLGCENCETHIGKFIGLPKEEPKREDYIQCPNIRNYGKCSVKGCGYCDFHRSPKVLDVRMESEMKLAEEIRLEKCKNGCICKCHSLEVEQPKCKEYGFNVHKCPQPESWEEEFERHFEDVQIHSRGLTCFQDAIRVFNIKTFISKTFQEQKKEFERAIINLKNGSVSNPSCQVIIDAISKEAKKALLEEILDKLPNGDECNCSYCQCEDDAIKAGAKCQHESYWKGFNAALKEINDIIKGLEA